jgi:hypothetical protein
MKKIIISSIIIVCFFITATAQTGAKSVYFELGGAGLASINYDMRLQNKEGGLGFRVGVGGFSIDGASAIFVPLGLNYLLGKDERNYFEIGGGVTIVSYKDDYFFTDNGNNFTSSFGHAYFGYRLQPKNGGFLFRAGITPIFTKEGFVPYWAGISFGYKF